MIIAVIPIFNEEKTIGEVIEKTRKHVDKIIVVDDGSEDKSCEIATKRKALVLRNIVNVGKGFSLLMGCEKAAKEADIIVTLDGDGQHDPLEIKKLIKNLKDCDIVFGSRKMEISAPFIKKIGNYVINFFSRVLFSVDIHDTQSGFKAFKSSAFNKLKWEACGYEVESEILMKVSKNKLKYKEVFIKNIYKDKFKGTTLFDGIKIVSNMIYWRVFR